MLYLDVITKKNVRGGGDERFHVLNFPLVSTGHGLWLSFLLGFWLTWQHQEECPSNPLQMCGAIHTGRTRRTQQENRASPYQHSILFKTKQLLKLEIRRPGAPWGMRGWTGAAWWRMSSGRRLGKWLKDIKEIINNSHYLEWNHSLCFDCLDYEYARMLVLWYLIH